MSSKKDGYVDQHIVPKSYLNRFATLGRNNKTYRIGVRQKDLTHYIDSTDHVGYIKKYYDDDSCDDIKKWEHFYDKEIEVPLSKVINKLITGLTLSNYTEGFLTTEDRRVLSRFFYTQFVRVPQFIDCQITNCKEILLPSIKQKCLMRFGAKYAEVINKVRIDDKDIKHLTLDYLNDNEQLERFSRLLLDKPWIVYINGCRDFLPFITSDNPIVLSNIISHSNSRTDNGLGNRETIIFCPINSYIGIGIYPNQFYRFFDDIQYTVISNQDIQFIGKMNCCELSQCYNQAFIPVNFFKEIYKEEHFE